MSPGRPPVALCFAGSGCLAAYQLGVVRRMQQNGASLLSRVTHVVGCSGGALVATVLTRAPAYIDLAIEYSVRCRNMSGVQAALAAAADADDETTGQNTQTARNEPPTLVITAATAAAPRRLCMFTQWDSKAELLGCLQASCHIPSDFHPLDIISPVASSYSSAVDFRGQKLVDGGLAAAIPTLSADNLLALGAAPPTQVAPQNLVVSPFAAPFDCMHIAPSGPTSWKQVSVAGQKFYANTANARRAAVAVGGGALEDMQRFVEEGESDCAKFLRETGQYETYERGASGVAVQPKEPPELLRKPCE